MKKLAIAALAATALLSACGAAPNRVAGSARMVGGPLAAHAAIKNPTALQKHVMFFDANNDGVITLDETKKGLKRLGLGSGFATGGALFINLGLRQAANGLSIEIAKIHKAKHGSDTGAFDGEGKFVLTRFGQIMTFDANKSGSLTWAELKVMLAKNKTDTTGNVASKAEFGLLIKLGADTTEAEGKEKAQAISEKRLAALYDGTLFHTIAAEREQKPKAEVEGTLPE